MSYNISNWKTVKLEDFRFPILGLYDPAQPRNLRKGVKCEMDPLGGSVKVTYGGTVRIEGRIDGEWLHADKVRCCGEGSGWDSENFLKPLFLQSKGILAADCIWDEGDDSSQERWIDGVHKSAEFKAQLTDVLPELSLYVSHSDQGGHIGSSSVALASSPEEAAALIDEQLRQYMGGDFKESDLVDPTKLKKYPTNKKRGIIVFDGNY